MRRFLHRSGGRTTPLYRTVHGMGCGVASSFDTWVRDEKESRRILPVVGFSYWIWIVKV
ncbi:hypothetical protein PNH38_12910 [Anoxybacillus rupiensis]|uniref:Uncharacterized protein n=1 Tax=Anoxybacteroides rupiense TaxID=311460 RepID=A0ABT5W621_9BACL|nr:hypothetical protein [Anoxybacillus rupiensis]MDE8564764.1 hypothetical protein [Anoxybacillus rupiensis]